MPYMIAATVMAAGLAWTIHVLVVDGPWETDSAMAIAIGTLVFSIVAMTALLLSRGRWTRYFAAGLIAAELPIALVGDIGPSLLIALALSLLALIGLGGPWLDGWLRERPAAGSPGVRPMMLAIGSFALVPLVGLASPAGLEPAHGALGAAGILFSWGYMRGRTWALYGLRFGLPVLTTFAAVASPPGGTALLLLAGAVLTYIAWTPEARLAVDPLPGLPNPRKRPS